ncbi:hypothetical protein C8Q80DRAFT_431767 [Daedaleopsis nitida]|nr:hypothetical protein C8Q80DRAFT_431767 [Daedaleopsis nitida]
MRSSSWSFVEIPYNARRIKRFGYAMNGTRQWDKYASLTGFDWEDFTDGSVFVDVGCGIGTTAAVIADARLHLCVVVVDHEQVIEKAIPAVPRGRKTCSLDPGSPRSFRGRARHTDT